MILVDSSAWVEFDRATGSAVDTRVTELIATEAPVTITEPVVMELLAGTRSDADEARMRRLLLRFALAPVDPVADFDAAARLYRRCRARGVTPRGQIDCLIAAVAWRTGAAILAADVDLSRIAGIIGIELDPASLRP